MHLAIITLCFPCKYSTSNYGNRLQNYALQEILKSLGFKSQSLQPCKKKSFVIFIAKFIANLILAKNRNGIHIKTFKDWQMQWQEYEMLPRKKAIKIFERKYIKLRYIRKNDLIFPSTLNSEYDFFIVGSDQVWSPLSYHLKWRSNNYLLKFAAPKKRIAYAASFGINQLPEEWKVEMAEELSKFKAISVRETAGARIIKDLIGKDVPVLLDPTMLLTANDWRSIETHQLIGSERYILAFFLGSQPKEVYAQIQEKAEELGAQVIEMMDSQSKYFALGPDGFLEMIDHAELVFTDSFHTVVFSILFHKPFYIYQRHLEDQLDISSRIETLLQKTGLTNRVLSGELPTEDDFEKSDRLLLKEREIAIQYLKNALNLNGDEKVKL